MKILILGGDGMLGHQLLLAWQKRHQVRVTLRQSSDAYRQHGIFNADNSYFNVDVRNMNELLEICTTFRPEAIVNAVGIVKQRPTAKEVIPSLEINAMLPHRLALLAQTISARLIHMSTDCVFTGSKGNYTEQDLPDAADLYGRSKLLGEVDMPGCVTLRTSIIGLELANKKSLIEWFLAQRGKIKGFARAIYSGVTTLEMSRIIERVLLQHSNLQGLWHVAANPIDKFSLLQKLKEDLDRTDVDIEPDHQFICDRSLNAERFCKATGYIAPSWDAMISELADQVKTRNSTMLCKNV